MCVNGIKSEENLKSKLKTIKDMNFEIDENELDTKSLDDLEKFILEYDKKYKQAMGLISQTKEFLTTRIYWVEKKKSF